MLNCLVETNSEGLNIQPQPKPLYWYSFNKYHIHKIYYEKVIRNGGFLTLIHIQKQLQEKSMVTLIIIENESVS